MRGEIELEDLNPERDNVDGIEQVYKAKIEYDRLTRMIKDWNDKRRAALRLKAATYLETALAWNDKKAGILYSRETMERNVRDIVKDQKLAEEIIKEYFTPVHKASAKANALKDSYRARVAEMKLSTKETRAMQKNGQISEAHAVQLLGEATDNIRELENSKGKIQQRDGKSLDDWRGIVQNMWAQNPQLDIEKIKGAVEEFRKIYDELFKQMNESRVRNGYEPVNYRSGYFPHFQPGDGGIIELFGKALGISTEVTALPTTINGLTHTFRPGIQWFGNAQQRLGFNTAYDAVEGFDKYIEGVADVITQTDNIQNLRALATEVRYRTGDDGIRDQIDAIYTDTSLSEDDKKNRIDKIFESGQYTLSNFVVELEEYTNLLANKKSRADRNMEQALGRNLFNVVKALESRVAANMVAINPASWLTNFIPLTQGGAMLNKVQLLNGMWQTLRSIKNDDGIVSASTFLTNRRGSDPLVRTWAQKTSGAMSNPMELIDKFTAGSLVRARYNQNLKRGMSEESAMDEADIWVAGVMADRSKGSMPTLFNRSNPITKVFTQFQLEVNNQLSYVFKDMPRALREEGLGALAWALIKFALGAWLFNEVYEFFIGRRPALDPIGILNDTVGDAFGYEMPNLVEFGWGAFRGKLPSFRVEKKNAYDTVSGLAGNVAEELPFVGGVLGGGRVPISSALPDVSNIAKAALSDQWSSEKKLTTIGKELGKPLTYIVPPFGGGQMKKIYQGVDAVIKGGKYTVDSDGNDILQYPVYNDTVLDTVTNAAQGMLFGTTSLPTGRDWVESNFKNLSNAETTAYKKMIEAGVPGKDAYDLIQAISKANKDTEKMKVIESASISDGQRAEVYREVIASKKEIAVMDEFQLSPASTYRFLVTLRQTDNYKKADYIDILADASGFSNEQKIILHKQKYPEDDKFAAIAGAGVPYEDYANAYDMHGEIDDSDMSAIEKAVEFSHWCNKQFSEKNAKTLRENLKFVSVMVADPKTYDKIQANGVSEESAYKISNALSALPEKATSLDRYTAVTDLKLSSKETFGALKSIMQEAAFNKVKIAYDNLVMPNVYVMYLQKLEEVNDSVASKKQDEAIAALNRMLIPKEDKAILWQLTNTGWKWYNNPYDKAVGEKIYNKLNSENKTSSGYVIPPASNKTSSGYVIPPASGKKSN